MFHCTEGRKFDRKTTCRVFFPLVCITDKKYILHKFTYNVILLYVTLQMLKINLTLKKKIAFFYSVFLFILQEYYFFISQVKEQYGGYSI